MYARPARRRRLCASGYALTRAQSADRRTGRPKRSGGAREQSSRDGLFNRGLGAEVQSVPAICWIARVPTVRSAQLRLERARRRGWRRRRSRRSRSPPVAAESPRRPPPGPPEVPPASPPRKRSRVGVGNRQVWRNSVADHRHLLREFDVSDGADAEVAYHPCDLDPILARHQCEGDRVCDLGRHRLSLRPMHGHHHRRVKVGPVEISQRRDHLTHLDQPLAPWDDGHAACRGAHPRSLACRCQRPSRSAPR